VNPAEIGGFKIVRQLGKGGMGAVYEALEPGTGRPVALKVLLGEGVDDVAIARFEREGRAAASVDHVHVARVHKLGRDARTGHPFLVSELIRGGSLHDRLKSRGTLDWREAASFGAQIARGLEAIHRAGLVHRDLKPANVLLDEEGRARITDFGLARSVSRESQRLTKTGELLGTLEYLAPEQADSAHHVGPEADLYSLGATIFALLSGEPPFTGLGHSVIMQILQKPPPRLSSRVAATPPSLDALVARLLEKDPKTRGTASEIAAALEAIAREAEPRRSVAMLVAVAVVGVVVAGGGLAWVFAGKTTPPPAPAATPTPRTRSVPEWYEKRAPDAKPAFPLPRGLSFGKNDGEYVHDADRSILVFVPAGRCTCGSDAVEAMLKRARTPEVNRVDRYLPPVGPARAVTLAAYFIGKYELRFAQFRRFVEEHHHRTDAEREGKSFVFYRDLDWRPNVASATFRRPEGVLAPEGEPSDDEPVVQVSWDDAVAYCRWANLRLPTEDEWERAALWDPKTRASRLYAWGNDRPGSQRLPGRVANVRDQSLLSAWDELDSSKGGEFPTDFLGHDDGFAMRAPVGSFPEGASLVGALDMTGNVSEWCDGVYIEEPHEDSGVPSGEKRIFRGGGWMDQPIYEIGAVRTRGTSDYRTNDLGFRVARSYP
jgi:serine/threonine-protein kinase